MWEGGKEPRGWILPAVGLTGKNPDFTQKEPFAEVSLGMIKPDHSVDCVESRPPWARLGVGAAQESPSWEPGACLKGGAVQVGRVVESGCSEPKENLTAKRADPRCTAHSTSTREVLCLAPR